MKRVEVKSPGGLDNLVVNEIDFDFAPKPFEVLVRWHATSLNFHDYLVAKGAIPVSDGRVPMSDGAGEVIAIGANVSQWKTGDKVMSLFFPNWIDGKVSMGKTRAISGESFHGYAVEKSLIDENSLTSIPEGFTYAEAATLPCAALTAWRGLFVEGGLQPGDSVLIEGSGGMSIFALQLAKAAGAKVYATTSSSEKAVRLKSMGVESVVNYKEDPKWGKTLFKMTGGIDHVLDVGGGITMNQSIEAVAVGGHITSIGILGGRKGEITFPKLFFKHVRLTGIAVGSREMQMAMVKAINQSDWRPIIDKSFGLNELADAFSYQETGKHFGKIVVEY